MKDGESVIDYCARTMGIANNMLFHGKKMGDIAIIETILWSSSPKCDYVVCSIEEFKDIDTLTLDEFQSSLLVHEPKINKTSATTEQALKASTQFFTGQEMGRIKGDGCNKDGGMHAKLDDKWRKRDQQFDKSKVECFRCHKFGHYRSQCRSNLFKAKEKRDKLNFAEEEEVETMLMAIHDKQEEPQNSYVWYVDTGCSNHMCGNKSSFSYLGEDFHATVSFGDKSTINVEGKGDISIRAKNGFVESISNVLFVPTLKSNLLSAGQLQEKGYVITISKGVCEIYYPSRGVIVVVIPMSSNRLFPLAIDCIQPFLMTKVKDNSWLWHFRYGHFNFGGLHTLKNKEMINGLPHITTPSQEKSKAFGAFTNFKALVENEAEKPIQALRIDRGGEYCSKEFSAFCENRGIRKELTAAYTPQQNGISERKNRTILHMLRSMLAGGRVPKRFWPEAVNWIIHVLNRSPTFVVQNMTSEEDWSGRRPNVDHFRIFGCIAYAHVPDAKRKKLDDKGEKCVFLGVSETSKSYKLFNPLTEKIVISRDIIFDEENTWNWDDLQSSQTFVDSEPEDERKQPFEDPIQETLKLGG
ncbi:hypothetical protein GQ457_05G026360 [Hibiscus cannabinus]